MRVALLYIKDRKRVFSNYCFFRAAAKALAMLPAGLCSSFRPLWRGFLFVVEGALRASFFSGPALA